MNVEGIGEHGVAANSGLLPDIRLGHAVHQDDVGTRYVGYVAELHLFELSQMSDDLQIELGRAEQQVEGVVVAHLSEVGSEPAHRITLGQYSCLGNFIAVPPFCLQSL